MLILQSPQVVQEMTLGWKPEAKIAFVPTMGCLHEGHLRLVETAKRLGQKTIVSVFVNPLQFGPGEDLERYPRPFEQDVAKLEAAGVDLLVAPSPKDFYPEDFQSRVRVQELSQYLCGASRPGHFEGVATVCLKLFQITQADFAVFGEKDFQQLRILQKMTEDLNLPIRIVPEPIVREADGLALSSRNQYLSAEQRQVAARIPRAWAQGLALARSNGQVLTSEILERVRAELPRELIEIDYLAIAPEKTLVPIETPTPLHDIPSPRLFIAAKVGATRLIDNVALRDTP